MPLPTASHSAGLWPPASMATARLPARLPSIDTAGSSASPGLRLRNRASMVVSLPMP